MSYNATVIQIMIASPGDVNEERDTIRRIIHSWNDLNAQTSKVVLLPVGWDTHSSTDLSGRPQELINGRLLEKCDLLVGVFWTRLGTPTGDHASGTVEEIKKHVDAGRTAMVYFSLRPVVPSSLDSDQYKKVLEFKEWCKGKGIVGSFDDNKDFEEIFRRELQIILRDNSYLSSLVKVVEPIQDLSTDQLQRVTISALAFDMLEHATNDKNGYITVAKLLAGTEFSAGQKDYDVSGGQREVARHLAAVEELESVGLIRDVGYKGEIYQVTNEGYEAIERVQQERE